MQHVGLGPSDHLKESVVWLEAVALAIIVASVGFAPHTAIVCTPGESRIALTCSSAIRPAHRTVAPVGLDGDIIFPASVETWENLAPRLREIGGGRIGAEGVPVRSTSGAMSGARAWHHR